MRRLVAIALVAACGSGASSSGGPGSEIKPPPTLSSPTQLVGSPALMDIAWLRGDWAQAEPDLQMHWNAAGGALYGVSLFESALYSVEIIDDAAGPGPADGKLRLYTFPGGMPGFELVGQAGKGRSVGFFDRATAVEQSYALDDTNRLHLTLNVADMTERNELVAMASPSRAPELEDADRAFAADVAKRGVAGWVAAFEPTGFMLSGESMKEKKPMRGAALGDMMKPLLESGALTWEPVASGVRGDLGFTVGTGTFVSSDAKASWKSSYVTIWAKQADGSWKVRFDIGRPVNE
jgi:ketosteroid isomerase-like protein